MLSFARRRFTFANVAMTVALVFAMSGGAFAASKFLITSTKQIKPSVLASLKGKAGANGAAGAQGPAGPAGPAGGVGPQGPAGTSGTNGEPGTEGKVGKNGTNGKEGSPWTDKGKLPAGATETGVWFIGPASEVGHKSTIGAMISFPIPLAAAIGESNVHIFEGGAPSGCSIEAGLLKASPGNLCIKLNSELSGGGLKASELAGFNVEPEDALEKGAGRTGLFLASPNAVAEGSQAGGTWAVTG
jgi:hypothetical protein